MKRLIMFAVAAFGLALSGMAAADKTAGDVVDDSWLHTKVKAAMVGHGSSEVNIEVYHGVVQMAAFITGEGQKKKLVDAVKGVEGVKSVSDQLYLVEGDRSAGTVLDDNTLTAEVKAALVEHDMAGINVEVNRSVVLLSGFVDSDEVKDKAIATANGVERVAKVIDGMDIKS